MTQHTKQADTAAAYSSLALASPPSRKQRTFRLLGAVLLVYLVTVGLTKIFYEMRGLGSLQQYLWTAAMLLQVYVPAWLLYRHDLTIAHFGLHMRRWPRSVLYAGGLFVLLLIPSVVGHHLWQMWLGRDERPTISLQKFSESLQGEPLWVDPRDVQVYTSKGPDEQITVRWQHPIHGVLQSDGLIHVVDGLRWIDGPIRAKEIRINGSGGAQPLFVRLTVEGSFLSFSFQRERRPLPASFLRFGPQRTTQSSTTLYKNLFWLLQLVLLQLLMVALPEEFFYRGYLLTRMDAIWPVRTLWGIPLSWGNLLSSLLFAFTHFLFGFQAYRLSVFFPSLLFGALRQKTNSLLAPILLHAASNILMKILELAYL
ncbi:CPBP family intramembrane metalloprotease [Myxococcota bacterium]|nr:CPBP family intramembrane metalloprotease [Myxococcota bacterium]